MRNQILLSVLLFSLMLSLVDCSSSGNQKREQFVADSIAQAKKIQDSTRIADSTRAALELEEKARRFNQLDSANTVAVMGIELNDANCGEITKIIAIDTITDPMVYTLYLMKALECKNRIFNEKNPEKATVTVAYQQDGKILFNTMRVNTAEKIADAAKKVITIGAFVKSGGDVPITTLATVAGNYSVDAYLKAAKTNSPLIILMPTAIPGTQLIQDALTLDVGNIAKALPVNPELPLKIVANGAEFAFVGTKAAVKLVASTPGYAIDATGKVVKVIGKGAEAVGGAAVDVGKTAANVATAPIRAIGKVLGF